MFKIFATHLASALFAVSVSSAFAADPAPVAAPAAADKKADKKEAHHDKKADKKDHDGKGGIMKEAHHDKKADKKEAHNDKNAAPAAAAPAERK